MADPYYDLIIHEDLAENRWPAEMDEIKEQEHVSLMAQVMTKELFDELKDKKSPSGWTIARAINTGVMNPTSFVGCHAGDLESYHVFEKLFTPVIEKYHVGFKVASSKHVTNMDPSSLTEELRPSAMERIISTRIRCARNLARFPLNPAGTLQTRLEVIDLVEKVCEGLDGELKGTLYRHSTMSDEQREQLIADHYLFRGRDKMQAASGYHEHWPQGRGVFVSDAKESVLWVNEGDHIRIISMEKGGDVVRVMSRLAKLAHAIETGIANVTGEDAKDVFMCDPVIGMVTCCPSNLGTGLRASVLMKIPHLLAKHGFKKVDEIALEMHCQVRGSFGEHSEVGDFVDVSNRRRLGVPEAELVQDMIRFVNKLDVMEAEAEASASA